jgi:hypothetical protein
MSIEMVEILKLANKNNSKDEGGFLYHNYNVIESFIFLPNFMKYLLSQHTNDSGYEIYNFVKLLRKWNFEKFIYHIIMGQWSGT